MQIAYDKPSKYRAAVLGGLIVGAISGIPGLNFVNCCCCAGVVLGGLLAYYFYSQELTPEMPPAEASDALILGILSGIIGAFLGTVIAVLVLVIVGPIDAQMLKNIFDALLKSVEDAGTLPQEQIDETRRQIEESLSGSMTAMGIISSLFVNLILYPIFAVIGAFLGQAIFRPKSVSTVSGT